MTLDPTDVSLCINDEPPPTATGSAPTSTPVVMTSLFTFPTLEALQAGLQAEHRTNVYSRGQNPTVEALERKIAQLERGETCKCFASGMAAVSAVMLGTLRAGDHVLFVNNTYGPTIQLAEQLAHFGITHDVLLDTDLESIDAALRPNTRLIWLESPGTMTFRVLDLPAIASLAKARGILTCIDNSWATPLLQKPILLGIDIVVHTGTKYLNGHSDVVAGMVTTTAERMQQIFYRSFLLQGGALGPQEAWLVLRGMRTLPTRLRQHEADALTIARALAAHPGVRTVLHPALITPPALLEAQLAGHTGVFAFELVRVDIAHVRQFVNALEHFHIGVSWGGVESLVIAPFNGSNAERLAAQRIPQGLVRLSVGLEGVELLLPDLLQALERVA